MDRYRSYAELCAAEQEGKDYQVFTREGPDSRFAIVAPHGGSMEEGTSELARAIAGDDYGIALFEGLKTVDDNLILHITSTRFDEPRCLQVIRRARTVIALHGERSSGEVVYLGGKDTDLGGRLSRALVDAGFDVRPHENAALRGVSPNNICNQGTSGRGVQLELSRGLRRRLFEGLMPRERQRQTQMFESFVATVRMVLFLPPVVGDRST